MTRSVQFNVTNSVWQWVLDTSRDLLNKNIIKEINTWMSDKKKNPTVKKIMKISKRTHLPLGYFFASNPPKDEFSNSFKFLQFRTVDNDDVLLDHPSRELLDTINDMDAKSQWLATYRIDHHESSFPFVGKYRNNYNQLSNEAIAKGILSYLHLPNDWNYNRNRKIQGYKDFSLLKSQLSDYGIAVINNTSIHRKPLNPDEFRAFVIINKHAPLIFINTKDYYNARLFSLVHELVHVSIGIPEFLNYNFQKSPEYVHKKLEHKVNRVVENIIFPKQEFLQKWTDWKKETNKKFRVYDMAPYFGASAISTAIRAEHLNLIKENIVLSIRNDFLNNKNNKETRGFPPYFPSLAYKMDDTLALDIVRSLHDGRTSYHRAFRLLNVNGTYQLHRLLKEIRKND